MKLVRKKYLNIFLIFTVLFSLVLPQLASAYTATGSAADPSLTIYKYEQEQGATNPDGTGDAGQSPTGTPLEGVKFQLTQTDSYDPATDKWTSVTGATPIEATTDASGKIVLTKAEGLKLGRYAVKEISGPAHVNLNTNTYYVDVPMTNSTGDKLNYNVVIYPKNETIRGAVQLTKLDGESTTTPKAPLAGVTFDLYKADGTKLQSDLVTDSDGHINVSGLAYGSYYFKETAVPAGSDYVLSGAKYNFSITQSGTIDASGTKTGTVETVTVTNYKAPSIVKKVEGAITTSTDPYGVNRQTEFTYNLDVTLPPDITSYTNFVITDTLDSNLSYANNWTVTGIDPSVLTFAQSGQKLTWTVNNFAALTGVKSFTINYKATINADAPLTPLPNGVTLDFTNGSGTDGSKTPPPVYVQATYGDFKVVKQDADTKAKLAGAVFELRKADGTLVGTATTDANGEITWPKLDYGNYTLVETKAPTGYRLLTSPIDVTIDETTLDATTNTYSIAVDNSKTGWILPTTGGMGTILFTVVGLSLIVLSLYLYRRKRAAN